MSTSSSSDSTSNPDLSTLEESIFVTNRYTDTRVVAITYVSEPGKATKSVHTHTELEQLRLALDSEMYMGDPCWIVIPQAATVHAGCTARFTISGWSNVRHLAIFKMEGELICDLKVFPGWWVQVEKGADPNECKKQEKGVWNEMPPEDREQAEQEDPPEDRKPAEQANPHNRTTPRQLIAGSCDHTVAALLTDEELKRFFTEDDRGAVMSRVNTALRATIKVINRRTDKAVLSTYDPPDEGFITGAKVALSINGELEVSFSRERVSRSPQFEILGPAENDHDETKKTKWGLGAMDTRGMVSVFVIEPGTPGDYTPKFCRNLDGGTKVRVFPEATGGVEITTWV
jgi:hypothetical protein